MWVGTRRYGLMANQMPCSRALMVGMQMYATVWVACTAQKACRDVEGGQERDMHKISPTQCPSIVVLHIDDDRPYSHEISKVTKENKRRYATRHGYEFVDLTTSKRNEVGSQSVNDETPQGKIHAWRSVCTSRQQSWILWSDADVLVVNQSIRLESIINGCWDMYVTQDWLTLNNGVVLFKCGSWLERFLRVVSESDALRQNPTQEQTILHRHIQTVPHARLHVKYIPKHVMNVYAEEYIPGDFIVHLAGKLYEATPIGATAIAKQFDVLSGVQDIVDISAFFDTRYLLNRYSGTCETGVGMRSREECKPDDARRQRLQQPLGLLARASRYWHVGKRYHWLAGWHDVHDHDDGLPGKDRCPRVSAGVTDDDHPK